MFSCRFWRGSRTFYGAIVINLSFRQKAASVCLYVLFGAGQIGRRIHADTMKIAHGHSDIVTMMQHAQLLELLTLLSFAGG
jgi:ACR3 family arsenite efflux pump ArsB